MVLPGKPVDDLSDPWASRVEKRMRDGLRSISYVRYESGRVEEVSGKVIEEVPLCLYINGHFWITLMCSPHDLEDLILGFLRAEGLIHSPDEIREVVPAPNHSCVDVWLSDPPAELPRRLTVTSGCGGGVTFEDVAAALPPLPDGPVISAEAIMALMTQLKQTAPLYRQARGVHSSALSDGERLLLLVEDVGRHNTLDRLWGQAMRRGYLTEGRLILTTGRISSEMLRKASRMRVPLVASRTSPTQLSVELAEAWNVTLVGYVRPHSLRVYTHPQRLKRAKEG